MKNKDHFTLSEFHKDHFKYQHDGASTSICHMLIWEVQRQNEIKTQTPNPKPQTPNPKPKAPNPKPQTPNPKPQILNF